MALEQAEETEITEPLEKSANRHTALDRIKTAFQAIVKKVLHPDRELNRKGFLEHFEALPLEHRTYEGKVLSGEEVWAAIPDRAAFNKELSTLEAFHLLGIDESGHLVIADADRELMRNFPKAAVKFVKTPLNLSTPQ